MTDIHCHIIPQIDDGAADVQTAIEMGRLAVEEGFKEIIATPHFIDGKYKNNRAFINREVIELNRILKYNRIRLTIYPGCEINIHADLGDITTDDQIGTLNGSAYLLVELPMSHIPAYTEAELFKLMIGGFRPIIAHPERNHEIMESPEKLFELVQKGALSQINATSITGLFGDDIQKVAFNLIRHRLAHFVATDAHSIKGRAPRVSEAVKKIEEILGHSETKKILENSSRVLNNRPIYVPEPVKINHQKYFTK